MTTETEITKRDITPQNAITVKPGWLMGPPDSVRGSLNLRRPLVVGITGDAGGGKTLLLARIVAKAMAGGMPAWTNFEVAFKMPQENGDKPKFLQSQDLDKTKFYSLNEEIAHGLVAITEMQLYVDSRQAMRVQNRVWNFALRQKRKRQLAIWYDAFDFYQVDLRVRAETDVLIHSKDLYYTPWGLYETNLEPGELFHLDCWDISGRWTGVKDGINPYVPQRYYIPPRISYRYWGKFLWDIYVTEKVVDPFDAQMKMTMEQASGRAANQQEAELDEAYWGPKIEKARQLFDDYEEVGQDELFANLQVFTDKEKKVMRTILNQMGVGMIRTSGGKRYWGYMETL